MLNLSVDIDTTYFYNLQGFNGTLSGATVRATEFIGTDKYGPGTFMFSNDGSGYSNSLRWSSRYNNNEDHAFKAAFIPIPGAVWLFGSALAGLGWLRRKQTA